LFESPRDVFFEFSPSRPHIRPIGASSARHAAQNSCSCLTQSRSVLLCLLIVLSGPHARPTLSKPSVIRRVIHSTSSLHLYSHHLHRLSPISLTQKEQRCRLRLPERPSSARPCRRLSWLRSLRARALRSRLLPRTVRLRARVEAAAGRARLVYVDPHCRLPNVRVLNVDGFDRSSLGSRRC
jgi:hypothetical protein